MLNITVIQYHQYAPNRFTIYNVIEDQELLLSMQANKMLYTGSRIQVVGLND